MESSLEGGSSGFCLQSPWRTRDKIMVFVWGLGVSCGEGQVAGERKAGERNYLRASAELTQVSHPPSAFQQLGRLTR